MNLQPAGSRSRSNPKAAAGPARGSSARPSPPRYSRRPWLALLLLLLQTLPSFAWVFPEHRDILVMATQRLDPDTRAQLQTLWSEARTGHEARLCAQAADPSQDSKPPCIDFAAWAAISGDHSCSAQDMLTTALTAPWILGVAQVAGRLKVQLTAARSRSDRTNAVRNSDLALERTDPEYVTRATSNNAHFLLARPNIQLDAPTYGRFALAPNAPINALGAYVLYHLRALDRAHSIATGTVPAASHADAVRAALADEAFAIHFLEDSFAAGHIAGNWGTSAMRKGTHDFYSERGLALVTWGGDHFIGQGDAYMLPSDADRAATAVHDSLAQVLQAFQGKVAVTEPDSPTYAQPEAFNVCKETQFPAAVGTRQDILLLVPILRQTPVPGLSRGPGELPRFRTEMGAFVGLSTGFRGVLLTHGFGPGEDGVSATSGIEIAARVGIGLDGVLNESSDGLVFVEGGVRDDADTIGAASIPGRGAVTGRLRMPFWLVPGDLVVAAPVLALVAPGKLQKMAVEAANGGVIPWQAGMATRIGRFQFVLGREVGVSIFRNGGDHTFPLPSPGVPAASTPTVSLNSLQVQFPILEYRLFRTFSVNQSSGIMLQPYAGFDIPTSVSVVAPPNAPTPDAHTIVTAGVRVVFDWRHYLK